MKRFFLFLITLVATVSGLSAQDLVQGTVISDEDNYPVVGALVTVAGTDRNVATDIDGRFEIPDVPRSAKILRVSYIGMTTLEVAIPAGHGGVRNVGEIRLSPESVDDYYFTNSNDFVFDEDQIADDEGMIQSVGTIQGATDDVFYQTASYNFSTLYYRMRGLDSSWQANYINGINFNDPMRGQFSYSSLGGLTSSAFRNKTTDIAMAPSAFGYGNIGGAQNYTTYASDYATGFRGNVSYTNSNYMLRAGVQYSTGLSKNGWAFSASVMARYAPEGIIEGTFYNSLAYSLSLQKVFAGGHSINLTTWGAPTERATAGATTQEAYDLAGSNLYNPSWGWFNGKKRSARVNKSFDPSATLNWIWKPSVNTTLNTAVGYRHNAYSSSRLNYMGYSPAPDYYRNMPSFFKPTANQETNPELYEAELSQFNYISDLWRNDQAFRQIDWDGIYQSNLLNCIQSDRDPEYRGQSYTILEDNHSNFGSWMFNSYINQRLSDAMTLQGGVSFNYSNAHYYKTVADLLGGEFWRDIDTYSERDFGHSTDILQNDMRNPNRLARKGDVFGYDYNIYSYIAKAWLQNEISTTHWDVNYGLEVSYTNFIRKGNMQNGRAPENSYGYGERHTFDNAAIKAGATYKINGRNYITAHASYGTRAPRPYDSYVSSRIKDTAVGDLKSERYLSGDISYTWNYARFRGSVTGFWTHMWDGMRHTGFFDYDAMSFMNYSITGLETEYKGVELGLEYKIMTGLSVKAAANYSRYQYKNNPMGIRSYENGAEADIARRVYLKNYHIGCTPQQAYSLGLNYNISNWFFDLNANWMGDNYYDVAYARHEEMPGLWKFCTSEEEYEARRDEITNQDKLKDCFVMNLSVGKMIYTKWGSLNFNVSLNNLLNNRNIQIRGWQDGKFDYTNYDINKFQNKVVYGQGIRLFVNVGVRF